MPADGGKAAASPPPPRSPVPVAGIVVETAPTYVIVRCPVCEREAQLPRHSGKVVTGKCRRCGSSVVLPSPGIVDTLTGITGMQRRLHAEERRLAAEDIAARLAGLTAGGGRGSMEGGQPVGIAGPAVSVSPSSRGPEPEPEPEPEPSSQGRARSVASDARCPSTVPDAGGAADRAAAGTPEPSRDDRQRAFARVLKRAYQRGGAPPSMAELQRLTDEELAETLRVRRLFQLDSVSPEVA